MPQNLIPVGSTSYQLSQLPIEIALVAVQANRATLIEQMQKQQMEALQEKNDRVAAHNTLFAMINSIVARNKDAKLGDVLFVLPAEKEKFAELTTKIGMSFDYLFEPQVNFINNNIQRQHYETASQKIKADIDNLSNSQQMDMLRLQTMSNRRNESFEMMSNFIKKSHDMASSVTKNMA